MIFETKIKTGKSFVSNIVTKNGTQTSVLSASKSITAVVKARGLPGAPADSASFGFVHITDSQYSKESPQQIEAGVRTPIELDGEGTNLEGFINSPFQADEMWQDDSLQAREVGDVLMVRLMFNGFSLIQSNEFTLEMDIGGAVGVIQSDQRHFPNSAGEERFFSINFLVFQLDTFKANGGKIYITPDADAAIWNARVLIAPLSVAGLM